MYGKMLAVSDAVSEMSERSENYLTARKLLYRAQCNCPYWHGVFGGLYLPHLRNAVYERLIRAETIAENHHGRRAKPALWWKDRNLDGTDEIMIDVGPARAGLKPAYGGHLFEFDHVEKAYNVLATLTRRRESYHRQVLENPARQNAEVASIHSAIQLKDPSARSKIVYDWYKKESLIEHFFGPDTDLRSLSRCRYRELGDFANMPYEAKTKTTDKEAVVTLTRHGGLTADEGRHAVTVTKKLTFEAGQTAFTAEYTVFNGAETDLEVDFGVEFNYALLGGEAPDRYYLNGQRRENLGNLSTMVELEETDSFAAVDEWKGIEWWLQFDRPAALWAFPVHTASMSEYGVELVYQCSSVVPHWRFALPPGASETFVVRFVPKDI